jgi:N-acetylglutamate synthase-like GNAT family acetyltransferase
VTPIQATDPYPWDKILTLVRTSYAFMESRINPPSSMHFLTPEKISEQAKTGEVWVIEAKDAPIACVFLTFESDHIYIGKLAVSEAMRGKGFARRLINLAGARAKTLGHTRLELQTRVELVENHAAFAKLGFVKVAEGAHSGFDHPTEITMRKELT